jgi:polyisoprenoid-binding protein YceI
MTHRSTGVRQDDDDLVVDGELTLHGITRQVSLTVEPTGFGPDPYGGTRAGFSATTKINRKNFGIDTERLHCRPPDRVRDPLQLGPPSPPG